MSSQQRVSERDRARLRAAAVDSARVIDKAVAHLPVDEAIPTLAQCRAILDATEAKLLAAQVAAGASDRMVENLLTSDGKTSKRSAKKRTRRADAVNKNPDIATKMETGQLSADQADVIATAADKTGGAAAEDEELIDNIASTPPDQGKKLADKWVAEHTSEEQVQDAHDKQRRKRCVKRWVTDNDTHVLAIEGDETSIDRAEQAINNRSNDLYQADGGRDMAPREHPRTRNQRDFDAAIDLLTNTTATQDKHRNGKPKTKSRSKARPHPRTTTVVSMTLEQATGSDPTPVCQVGGALIAPSMLAEMLCDAEVAALVNDPTGSPLMLGQSRRLFDDDQWLALIARDQGCVRCGAHYSKCEAHHIIPRESPARGPTDIDNGALLCVDCHHFIHEHDLILIRDPETGTWTTRPAQPHEQVPHHHPRPEHRRPSVDERRRNGTLF